MKSVNVIILVVVVLGSFLLVAFITPQDQPAPWEVPSKYLKMKNPYKDDASLKKIGKMMWAKHCKSCHGGGGLGDGPKAKQLETFSGDFSTEAFQEQTDGALWYKTFIGRDEMPGFEKKIPDEEDQWAVVNYMRTFAK